MRQCGDNRPIGRAIADEALLQQQEFPDLAGSPAFFLVCRPRSIPSAHAAAAMGNEAVAASSPPGEAAVGPFFSPSPDDLF
jgi:hypothetical protein